MHVCQGFHQVWYQGIVKATVFGVLEDLNFEISEGSDQNLSCPGSALLAVSVQHYNGAYTVYILWLCR